MQTLAATPGKCHCKQRFRAARLFLQAVAENSSSAKYNDKLFTSALRLRFLLLSFRRPLCLCCIMYPQIAHFRAHNRAGEVRETNTGESSGAARGRSNEVCRVKYGESYNFSAFATTLTDNSDSKDAANDATVQKGQPPGFSEEKTRSRCRTMLQRLHWHQIKVSAFGSPINIKVYS